MQARQRLEYERNYVPPTWNPASSDVAETKSASTTTSAVHQKVLLDHTARQLQLKKSCNDALELEKIAEGCSPTHPGYSTNFRVALNAYKMVNQQLAESIGSTQHVCAILKSDVHVHPDSNIFFSQTIVENEKYLKLLIVLQQRYDDRTEILSAKIQGREQGRMRSWRGAYIRSQI